MCIRDRRSPVCSTGISSRRESRGLRARAGCLKRAGEPEARRWEHAEVRGPRLQMGEMPPQPPPSAEGGSLV
eukprot:8692555-Alexandrium_andersonii.AAC.1